MLFLFHRFVNGHRIFHTQEDFDVLIDVALVHQFPGVRRHKRCVHVCSVHHRRVPNTRGRGNQLVSDDLIRAVFKGNHFFHREGFNQFFGLLGKETGCRWDACLVSKDGTQPLFAKSTSRYKDFAKRGGLKTLNVKGADQVIRTNITRIQQELA